MTDTPPKNASPKSGAATWAVAAVVVAALVGFAVYRQREAADGDGAGKNGGLGHFGLVDDHDAAQVAIDLAAPAEISPAPPMRVLRLDAGEALDARDVERLADTGGGAALYVGPEKFNDNWKENVAAGKVTRDESSFGHPDAEYPGFARYAFRVPETGAYELWLLKYWVDDCGNSVDVAIDGAPPATLTDMIVGRWAWLRLNNADGSARRFTLDAGRDHALTLANREDDCYLETVLLRDADAGLPDPVAPAPKR